MKNIGIFVVIFGMMVGILTGWAPIAHAGAVEDTAIIEELLDNDFLYNKETNLWEIRQTEAGGINRKYIDYVVGHYSFDDSILYATLIEWEMNEEYEYVLVETHEIKGVFDFEEEDFMITEDLVHYYNGNQP